MTFQSFQPAAISRPQRAQRLQFWRPVPREDADIICGEGAVAEVPLHAHRALQIMLPASPFTVIDARHGGLVVRPGQVHVTAPLELCGARGVGGEPCAMRILLVAPVGRAPFGEDESPLWRGAEVGRRQFILDDPALYGDLWALIEDLRGPLVALPCAPRLRKLVGRVFARLGAGPPVVPAPGAGRQALAVARVCEHLRAHVAESLSLDELASVAGLSKFYLLRAFSRTHGLTPHAYQMHLRLAHAWRLIVEGSPLSRATYDAGFADQSHFTRRFAAHFGVTPARYLRELAAPLERLRSA